MVTRSYKIGADKFVAADPHLRFLVDDSGLAEMARNHAFVLVQPLPFLSAHEADLLPLGIYLQHPGDLLHGPQGSVRAIRITIAFGYANPDGLFHKRAINVFLAVGRTPQNHAVGTRIAQAWRIHRSGTLKYFEVFHIPFLIERVEV